MPRPKFTPALALVFTLAATADAQPNPRFAPYPEGRFSVMAKQSINAYFDAEDAYKAGDYEKAKQILTAFWKKYPAGTAAWEKADGDAGQLNETTGANFGDPPCYYALRMLTDCVNWRANKKDGQGKGFPVTWTVVLIGKSEGVQPRNQQELKNKTGVRVTNTLNPKLAANDYQILRESQWLFIEYVSAMTAGNLAVKVEYVTLPNFTAAAEVTSVGGNSAQITGAAVNAAIARLPEATRRKTDWWFVIHPSHLPNKYPPFAKTEFFTGGMGVGPDGNSPCFLIDDLWFARKPPHIGSGDYADHERRAYLPQWLQHEFYHHLFRTYPDFKLEAKGHQWFDRKTWPDDFVGRNEPDYYHQALHKRLRTADAKPRMAVALRYAGPSAEVLRGIALEDIAGEYVRNPAENDYHKGRITIEKDKNGKQSLRWTNAANVTWKLTPDLPNGVLNTGPDNPYFKDAQDDGPRVFRLVLPRGADGEFQSQVRAFKFSGDEYVRQRKK